MLEGDTSFKDSLRNRGISALKGVGQSVLDQTGSGRRRVNNYLLSRRRRKPRRVVKQVKRRAVRKRKPSKKPKKKTSAGELRYLF